MSRTFGQVVAVLRKELRDEEGRVWSQTKLGEASGLGIHIIANIETGRRAPDPATLAALARALELTMQEERELALLAMREQKPALRQPIDPQVFLHHKLDQMAAIPFPAILHDDYGDLIAVNSAVMRFLGLSQQRLAAAGNFSVTQYHTMRLIFDPALSYEQMLGECWQAIAINQMQFFRRLALKRRAAVRMAAILSELRTLRRFRTLWEQASYDRTWIETSPLEYTYRHPAGGEMLHYMGLPTVFPTPWGDLVLGVFMPLNPATSELFADNDEPARIMSLAEWPKSPEDEALCVYNG